MIHRFVRADPLAFSAQNLLDRRASFTNMSSIRCDFMVFVTQQRLNWWVVGRDCTKSLSERHAGFSLNASEIIDLMVWMRRYIFEMRCSLILAMFRHIAWLIDFWADARDLRLCSESLRRATFRICCSFLIFGRAGAETDESPQRCAPLLTLSALKIMFVCIFNAIL